MKRVNIRISDLMHEWYMEKSEQRGVTASSLMNEALDDFMQKDNKPNVNASNMPVTNLSGWHRGYDEIKLDCFKIGSLEVYCSRRKSGMPEENAYKIMQKYTEHRFLSIMEWVFYNNYELEKLISEFKEQNNKANLDFTQLLKKADIVEKLKISQEVFKYYKAVKYEPADVFELMYQETLVS